ncbi:MAG TPA: SIMPL domain-containing protein [Candidatus Paceibacterota bacterium]|nr:SIMPL domain-containing protein [Candidatus Paceibacterota bacterium]
MNQKIKDYLGIALIFTAVAAAVAGWRYVDSYSRSTISSRTFSAQAEGKAIAIPDIAQFSFSVITEGGKDIASIQKQNTKKMNDVIDFVKSEGVDSKDIKTTGYSVEPRYQNYTCNTSDIESGRFCPPPEIVGYTVRQNVSVKIRDFAKIGGILSGVVQKGANSVSGVSFSLDDPTAVQAEARAKAIEKAKAKAAELARAGGFRIGRLVSINDGGFYYPVYERAFGMGGDGATKLPVPTIESGSQEIVVNVSLVYEIR